jgi:oligoendopeptidase F
MLNATDISLVFLGILIIMVLLEVRKLSRKPEPVSRLEAKFDRLSEQMERIGAPPDIELPGGAQIVAAGETFETISEQLERLGESAEVLDLEMLGEEGARRFHEGLQQLRSDLKAAQQLFERAAAGLGQASDAVLAAGSALQRIETRIEDILAPAAPKPGGKRSRRAEEGTKREGGGARQGGG